TVAVSGPRCAAVVAAMWAVVGAGSTYLPLDGSYPGKRRARMLADSGAEVLLYADADPGMAGVRGVRIPEWGEVAEAAGSGLGFVSCGRDVPVYVVYTSGSTGLPKGVAVPHGCIDNMADWQRRHSVRKDLRTAQFAPLSFDVWFQEVLS